MGTQHTHPSHSAAVIDLAAISGPARRAVAIYDEIRAGRPPHDDDLGDALKALRELPRPPGRLGRDIALLIDGGTDATKVEIAAAFERLRLVSAIRSPRLQHPQPKVPRRRDRRGTAGQLPLPGIFDQLTPGTTP